MFKGNWDKLFFVMGLLALSFLYGAMTVSIEIFPYSILRDARMAAMDWKENWRKNLQIEPTSFYYPAVYEGEGVTLHDATKSQPGVTLVSGVLGQQVSLWLLDAQGELVHQWPVKATELWPDLDHLKGHHAPKSDWDVQIHGAELLPGGDVIFNIEFIGLIRMDKCGNVVWRLPYMTHHSIYKSNDSTYWVSGRKYHDRAAPEYPGMKPGFWEPTVIQVTADGIILKEISLLDVIYANNLQAMIFAGGPQGDWAHLNDVEIIEQDAAQASDLFDYGDILVSLRNLHLMFVFSADTLAIKWHRTGPWLNQHDPDVLPDGTISVFDNRRLRDRGFGEPLGGLSPIFDGSRILVINPVTNEISTVYEGSEDNPFYTNVMGKHQYLENGNTLISQSEGGRAFEVTSNGELVWQYINRYDGDRVAVIQQADRYPVEYENFVRGACQ